MKSIYNDGTYNNSYSLSLGMNDSSCNNVTIF